MNAMQERVRPDAVGTRTLSAVTLMLIGMLAAGTALAAPITIRSQTDHSQANAFVLDFGVFGEIDGLGPVRTGLISRTDLEIEIDIDADIPSARFTRYDQSVDPIILPGGFDTGNIRVELVPGSSSGTFDKQTGIFETTELYTIYFDGNLEPLVEGDFVVLESSSTGFVSLDDMTLGVVSMEWNGETTIGSGDFVIPIVYSCSVNNHFVPNAAELLALDIDPRVLNLALPTLLETRLIQHLEIARTGAVNGNTFDAITALRRFIRNVSNAADNATIELADADDLIDRAEFAIELIRDASIFWPKSTR